MSAVFHKFGLSGLCLALLVTAALSWNISERHSDYLEFNAKVIELWRLDTKLHEHILRAKEGLDNNYDPISLVSDMLQKNLAQVKADIQQDFLGTAASELIEKYENQVTKRAILVEDFKSYNSLIHNSLRYLPKIATEIDVPNPRIRDSDRRRLQILVRNASAFAANSAELSEHEFKAVADKVVVTSEVRELMDHIQNIVTTTSKINALISEYETLRSQKTFDELRDEVSNQLELLKTRLNNIGTLLFLLCLLLTLYIYYLIQLLHRQNSTLEEQVLTRTAQLTQSQETLVQSAKMASLGQMAAGIAHEINNPLGTILLRARHIGLLAKKEDGSREQIGEFAAVIEKTGQRIEAVVKGLRSFSRSDPQDDFIKKGANELIAETVAFCSESYENHEVSLRITSNANDTEIECKPNQISQVILNLLQNSLQEMKKLPKASRWVSLDVLHSNKQLQISIMDAGSGIPEEVRKKLFEPFFTTKEIGEGTGLGLSISKGIVNSHKGQISIDPTCKNTRFVVTLPISQEAVS